MNITLVITVGTRDVQLKEGFSENLPSKILEEFKPFHQKNTSFPGLYIIEKPREAGSFLYKNWYFFKDNIILPIIEPTLKHLKKVDNLILVLTDQPKPHDRDTVNLKDIIVDTIKEKNYLENIPKFYTLKIHDNKVNLLDAMYDYVHEKLSDEPYCSILNESEKIYLHLVGGIDAINHAVRMSVMNSYGE